MDSSIEKIAPEPPMPDPTPTTAVAIEVHPAMADPRYAAYVPALVVGSSNTVTNPKSPFYCHTTNSPNHKFKYPETAPTPNNEDDVQWGKIYTAADSRKYNHSNKSAAESKKVRISGATYQLALQMLVENKQKYAIAVQNAILRGDPIPTEIPRATPKPYSPDDPIPAPRAVHQSRSASRMEQPSSDSQSRLGEVLSISESLKLQGRTSRQTSAASSLLNSNSNQNMSASYSGTLPAPNTAPNYSGYLVPLDDDMYFLNHIKRPSGLPFPVEKGYEAPGPRARTMTTLSAVKLPSSAKRSAELLKKSGSKKAKTEAPIANYSDYVHHKTPPSSITQTLHSLKIVDNKHHHPRSTTNHWAHYDHGRNVQGEKLYCKCRSPDDRSHMIQCSNGVCSEWFHITCVPSLSIYMAEQVVEYFYCDLCTTKDTFTTYKRLCRNNALMGPGVVKQCWGLARVTGSGPTAVGSKYCSDECGMEFWFYIVQNVFQKEVQTLGGPISTTDFANIVLSCKELKQYQELGQFKYPKRRHVPIPRFTADGVPDEDGDARLTDDEEGLLYGIDGHKGQATQQIEMTDRQIEFFKLVCARAEAAATHLGCKVSAICGYDNRLSMNDWQFTVYERTPEFRNAMEDKILGPATAYTLGILAKGPEHSDFDPTDYIGLVAYTDGAYPTLRPVDPSNPAEHVEDAFGCELPDVLQNICLEPVNLNPKLKPNCKHNTCGALWRDRTDEELYHKKRKAIAWMEALHDSAHQIYKTSAETSFMKPVDLVGNGTTTFE